MRLSCGPRGYEFPEDNSLQVVLFGQPDQIATQGSAGNDLLAQFKMQKLHPLQLAWDFLSIALSVQAADLAGHRSLSPDGWTRQFELTVAVSEPSFWNAQKESLRSALGFLTTDIWSLTFTDGGAVAPSQAQTSIIDSDSVILLSGGLDSLIGTLDAVADGRTPYAVSQTVRGDAEKQRDFASGIGLKHIQMNHNTRVPNPENPPTQRARSLIFLAEAVAVASARLQPGQNEPLPILLCENGFISINPPLTESRIGSLSTRTTHPVFIQKIQSILSASGIKVAIENPYQFQTKGQMMSECRNKPKLATLATTSTSCGRFNHFGNRHCGRCVPCQIRRAAFLASGVSDNTTYVYDLLGKSDADHAGFDDVRSVAMAIEYVHTHGVANWLGASLTGISGPRTSYLKMIGEGINELENLHKHYGVR